MKLVTKNTKCLEKNISEITEEWIKSYTNELSLFESGNSWEEVWREYREEPLLSFFSTGIARNDAKREISIVREYPVYSKEGFVGRSDLFLNYHIQDYHFYIEAKYEKGVWSTGFIEWSEQELLSYLNVVEKQLGKYSVVEKDKDVKSFDVIIIFHFVHFKDKADFDRYITDAESYKLKDNQFYALITSNNPEKSRYNNFGIHELVGFVKEILN